LHIIWRAWPRQYGFRCRWKGRLRSGVNVGCAARAAPSHRLWDARPKQRRNAELPPCRPIYSGNPNLSSRKSPTQNPRAPFGTRTMKERRRPRRLKPSSPAEAVRQRPAPPAHERTKPTAGRRSGAGVKLRPAGGGIHCR
jgi:hypothetical protein